MNQDKDAIDIEIHAYVDGQLSESRRLAVLARLQQNADLRRQVADLQMLKMMVQTAYAPFAQTTQVHFQPISGSQQRGAVMMRRMAASFVVVLALSVGWLGNGWWQAQQAAVVLPMGAAHSAGNYLLQMSAGDHQLWQKSITEVERLLSLSPHVRVELLVNDEGIAMLSNQSDVAEKLGQLVSSDRLKLVACRQGLENWRERGMSVNLMPQVDTSHSALEEIVQRLGQGWHLIPVDRLMPV